MAAAAQGNMGGERFPSEVDLARAFFCAEAVSRGSNSEIEEFLRSVTKEFSFIQFGEVQVSVELNEFKFLTAVAVDALFVAFQASDSEARFGRDFSTLIGTEGSVDRGILAISKSFGGLDFQVLAELFRSHDRIRRVGMGTGAPYRRWLSCIILLGKNS